MSSGFLAISVAFCKSFSIFMCSESLAFGQAHYYSVSYELIMYRSCNAFLWATVFFLNVEQDGYFNFSLTCLKLSRAKMFQSALVISDIVSDLNLLRRGLNCSILIM